MKLVLLPGMDGTGELFSSLLPELNSVDYLVIPFPQTGRQDYHTLTAFIREKLPDQDFILLAESFSGPIAANLAKENIPSLKGVIFVATFLSSPNRLMLAFSRLLPLKLLTKFPGSTYVQRLLFFGEDASKKMLKTFQNIIHSLPAKILKDRMKTMQLLVYQDFKIDIPAAYILPKFDKLVPSKKVLEFQKCFCDLILMEINGSHFILQTKPKESAEIILELTYKFIKSLH